VEKGVVPKVTGTDLLEGPGITVGLFSALVLSEFEFDSVDFFLN